MPRQSSWRSSNPNQRVNKPQFIPTYRRTIEMNKPRREYNNKLYKLATLTYGQSREKKLKKRIEIGKFTLGLKTRVVSLCNICISSTESKNLFSFCQMWCLSRYGET